VVWKSGQVKQALGCGQFVAEWVWCVRHVADVGTFAALQGIGSAVIRSFVTPAGCYVTGRAVTQSRDLPTGRSALDSDDR